MWRALHSIHQYTNQVRERERIKEKEKEKDEIKKEEMEMNDELIEGLHRVDDLHEFHSLL